MGGSIQRVAVGSPLTTIWMPGAGRDGAWLNLEGSNSTTRGLCAVLLTAIGALRIARDGEGKSASGGRWSAKARTPKALLTSCEASGFMYNGGGGGGGEGFAGELGTPFHHAIHKPRRRGGRGPDNLGVSGLGAVQGL